MLLASAAWRWLLRVLRPAYSRPHVPVDAAGAQPVQSVPSPTGAPAASLPTAEIGAPPGASPAGASRLRIVAYRFVEGPRVTYHSSPNHAGRFGSGRPDTIVLHYTAGGTTYGAVTALCDPRPVAPSSRVSAHVVVGRDGEIVQLVPLDMIAWHAGESTWQGRAGCNRYSLGIELVNWGMLRATSTGYAAWTGATVPSAEVAIRGGFWQRYTEAQIAAVEELLRVLVAAFPIRWLLGHEQVAPGRKSDPGPAFPWARVRRECGFAADGSAS